MKPDVDTAEIIPTRSPWAARRQRRLLGHLAAWLRRSARARRVFLLVAFIWIVSAFDLSLTLSARHEDQFIEVNPIARPMLASPETLALFKVGLVTLGSLVLLRFRRRRLTEIGCWAVALAYGGLAGAWWIYYFGPGR